MEAVLGAEAARGTGLAVGGEFIGSHGIAEGGEEHGERPYKVVGYPVVPAVFVAASFYLVINALITDPVWTSITFGVVLAGLPVYYAAFRTQAAQA